VTVSEQRGGALVPDAFSDLAAPVPAENPVV
jgi:hypothetical protein